MGFKIGCQLITWRSNYDQEKNTVKFGLPADIPTMLSEVKQAGYDGVGGVNAGSIEELASYLLNCRRLGLGIAQLGGPIELSAALGIPSNMSGAPLRKQFHDGSPTEEDFQKAVSDMAALVDKGRELGVQVYLHNHLWTLAESREEIDRFMQNIPDLKLCPDVAHLKAAGGDPLALIRDYADRLANVHLKDWLQFEGKPGPFDYPPGIFVELGQGNIGIDIPAIMSLLEDIGYDGWVVVELDITRYTPFESAKMSRQYLKSLGY